MCEFNFSQIIKGNNLICVELEMDINFSWDFETFFLLLIRDWLFEFQTAIHKDRKNNENEMSGFQDRRDTQISPWLLDPHQGM